MANQQTKMIYFHQILYGGGKNYVFRANKTK